MVSFNPSLPKAGVGIYEDIELTSVSTSFNPSLPKAGVGIFGHRGETISSVLGFQSIFAQSGRWNVLGGDYTKNAGVSFNPSLPKAGVGIGQICFAATTSNPTFQSIFAQSGRWNDQYAKC